MNQVYTRAQHRDQQRRILGQIPPIDDGAGAAGAQPTRWPEPTNPNPNFQMDFAVAWVGRKCKVAGTAFPVSIPIEGVSTNGPYQIKLQTIAPFGSTNNVQRVTWLQDGINEQTLFPRNRAEIDRFPNSLMTQAPGAPIYFWEEFDTLSIWPAPVSSGVLNLMTGTALWTQSQQIDGEVVAIIPQEYAPIIDYKTVSLICSQQLEDREWQKIQALCEREVQDILPDLQYEMMTRNRRYQSSNVAKTGRAGTYGGRR